jgi:K319-like protein
VGAPPVAQGPLPSTVPIDVTVTPANNYTIDSYQWVQDSGPATPVILSPSSPDTSIRFDTYVPGKYVFRLIISGRFTDSDDEAPPSMRSVTVTVPKAKAPVVSNGRTSVTYP